VSNLRHRFLFSEGNIRGIWLNLESAYQELVSQSSYPEIIQSVLGDACVASSLLAATIKSQGSLTMQLQASGNINLMVMQALADGSLRGMANWNEGAELSKQQLFGKEGKLVITLDPGEGKKRYQGITELVDDSLLATLENYLTRSEQLPTRLWLANNSGKKAAGLLLQQLPDADPEYWQHLTILADTISTDELLDLTAEQTLTRLFHQESLELFPAEAIQFNCSCSNQKVVDMIIAMGQTDAEAVINEKSAFEVKCEFCSRAYVFDQVDIESIFKTGKLAKLDDNIH